MPPPSEVPAAILGATGYVAGELMRLLAFHPRLRLAAAVSRSRAGEPLAAAFPHLHGAWDELRFAGDEALDGLLAASGPAAVFSCLPHSEAAARLDAVMSAARSELRVVDLSADFRLPSAADYEAVYGTPHGAPGRCADFTCGLPELSPGREDPDPQGPPTAVAHPGCFTTATVLACAPAQARGLARPHFRVSAVTGSTGSGRTPSATTHHPERHGNLRAYKPLVHRHAPEMEMLLARLGGVAPTVSFVPHSGPFARGIHATVHFDLVRPLAAEELAETYADFYAAAPFVSAGPAPPNLKEVVATNRCRIGVAARGTSAVAMAVIDNLTKGAAGGAVQWMNRLWGFDETLGLRLPGVGWG